MARVAAKRPGPMYKAGLVDKVVERASIVPDFTLPLAPSNFTCSPKHADVAGVLCYVTEILYELCTFDLFRLHDRPEICKVNIHTRTHTLDTYHLSTIHTFTYRRYSPRPEGITFWSSKASKVLGKGSYVELSPLMALEVS